MIVTSNRGLQIKQLKQLVTYSIVLLCCLPAYTQSLQKNEEKWQNLQAAAHRIGFCVYQVKETVCTAHQQKSKSKTAAYTETEEVYYFEFDCTWANKRITNWADTNTTSAEQYLMLFDTDQKNTKTAPNTTTTSNSYGMFSILDCTLTYDYKTRVTASIGINATVIARKKNSILSNTLWREFMSGREGRLETTISIPLYGNNAAQDFEAFKEAFINYLAN
ncbi:hypothetical protein [Aquimarina brevivitae]|nr:hypothetical protein [Aquimarina brevivitae]